ncbi:hypothetical protein HGRIS_003253 [Hohenbuehelia grisea]|uniref:Uncharacterized protein n=1 Tax=Hohenbuehelia grisea TaxID=104357 RepID=A0ABR3JQ24_9AGAR
MVSYTFRFKAFLSKLPVFSSIMSKSPPPPHPAALYLFPTTGVKEFTASEWFTLRREPVLFCKDRDGVEHEFLFIYYECVHRRADETYGSTTGWLRIDRCIDKTKLVPAEERKHALLHRSPVYPRPVHTRVHLPGEPRRSFCADTVPGVRKTKEQLEAEREREATARKRAEAERDRLEAALKEAEEKIASYNRTKGP